MTKQYVTTPVVKKNQIKLPHELANHPYIADAKIKVEDDLVTFVLPPANPNESVASDIWQYVHAKESWVMVTFTK